MQYAIDILEQNRLWDWTIETNKGTCSSCAREKDLYARSLCGACITLSRCYDGKVLRLEAQVVFAGGGRTIVWMNPNPKAKFGKNVQVINPSPGRCYLQDALEFISQERNRLKPYLFLMFHLKTSMSVHDLRVNIDPDHLFVSTNRGRPYHSATPFRNSVDVRAVGEILKQNINFGRGTPADRRRLLSEGFAPEELTTPHWKMTQIIKAGSPKTWF